ncbi:MAG: hypothetical protein ACREA2_08835 [Blastocatellia bacterium]
MARLEYLSYLADWLSVSHCLCLDINVPLHKEMGLMLPNSEILPQVFRDGVLRIGEQGRIDDTIIKDFKRKILSNFGAEGLQHFLVWFFTVYRDDRNAPGWGEWVLFWEIAIIDSTYCESLRTVADVNNDQVRLLEEYDDNCFSWEDNAEDHTARLLKELRGTKLSSWDRRFMLENNRGAVEIKVAWPSEKEETDVISWDRRYMLEVGIEVADIGELIEVTDVFSGAIGSISMNRFQMGWEQLWSNFTNEQKSKIAETGEKFLTSISGGQRSHHLPHPDTLIRYNCSL